MRNLFGHALNHPKVWQREIVSGITAFFAISYIIIVNPLILADAGIPVELSVFATIFSSVIGCLLMAFVANAPIVLTPGMGINAFFTYTICVQMGLSWHEALAISLLSGVIFALVACTPLAGKLSRAVPPSLKCAITVGIGLFLVEIGLEKAQLIRRGTNSIIELGSLTNPAALLAIFGLILSLGLYLRNVMGSFFIAIIATSVLGYFLGVSEASQISVNLASVSDYPQLLLQADFSRLLSIPFLLAVFSMSMIMVFETMGLLEGILPNQAKFAKTFKGSAITTILSSVMGTSPTVAAAESAAGIASGGRTGLMALTASVLFILSLFFIPLLAYVPAAAIAPVIIITGAMMMQQLKYMTFDDFSEWFPAFLVVVLIPLSGSISTGLAFGFAAYPLLKFLSGNGREVHALSYVLGFLFLLNLVFQARF
ncbi:NCS2 family permease [Selenomonas ruminantium]|uniref:Putative MFS transporter, AGZA family, xanthine/uracil permease n=1 Tax=Selenomonas ruminantium TaxID=971 RepID=A0A1H0SUT6_SELRU|nr:NCS2 family permease [Selenomonas ruminantium]SDP45046.1 putative MFS transporter, AGZA family, xanthine/uracil permease [Selenomonas ruminantium]